MIQFEKQYKYSSKIFTTIKERKIVELSDKRACKQVYIQVS